MQKNQVLKQLLAVSAVAAILGAFHAHAQTSPSTAPQSTPQTKQGAAGASDTHSGGTGGMHGSDAAPGAAGQSGTAGQTGATGQGMTGQSSSGAAAAGQTAASGSAKLSKADEKIVMNMARANIAEIEAGKLALSKSQDEQVKSFAQQMIDDHTKALADVQALAQARGVTLPTEPDSKHKSMAAKMEKLTGDAFNREYMKQAGVADHKKVHAMLQKEQKSAKDADVKALAAKMLPTVEQHLKAAQAMPAAKNGTSSGK